MDIISQNIYIDAVFAQYKTELGKQYTAYKNHVYRVFNLTLQAGDFTGDETDAIAIAAAFHDIGIWTAHTFDYLKPSVELAKEYAEKNNKTEDIQLITELINNHHKLTAYKQDKAVEAFRRADLIDLSLDLFTFGIKRKELRELNKAFPFEGFHRFIFGQIFKNIIRHPLNPLPIVKF